MNAEPNVEHRLLYLDFEGPLPGGRGIVHRWDAGTFDWIKDERDYIVIDLRGAKLVGPCTIDGILWRMP